MYIIPLVLSLFHSSSLSSAWYWHLWACSPSSSASCTFISLFCHAYVPPIYRLIYRLMPNLFECGWFLSAVSPTHHLTLLSSSAICWVLKAYCRLLSFPQLPCVCRCHGLFSSKTSRQSDLAKFTRMLHVQRAYASKHTEYRCATQLAYGMSLHRKEALNCESAVMYLKMIALKTKCAMNSIKHGGQEQGAAKRWTHAISKWGGYEAKHK